MARTTTTVSRVARAVLLGASTLCLASAPLTQSPGTPSSADDIRSAILAADDDRVTAAAHRQLIASALAHGLPDINALALRAMGRTQRQEFLSDAVSGLRHPSTEVRREAAFAVAHIGAGSPEAFGPAQQALQEALATERDADVLASLAEEYGRLPFDDATAVDDAAGRLSSLLARSGGGEAARSADLGVARGAESLARRATRLNVQSSALHDVLATLLSASAAASGDQQRERVRVRRLATAGLLALPQPAPASIERALADPDSQIRRLGVIAASRTSLASETAMREWLADAAFLVRHAAVSRVGARMPALAERASADAALGVRLAALDALGEGRACTATCRARLEGEAAFGAAWHEAAHALVALAGTDPASARVHIARAAASDVWQVRMYAARAAGIAGQRDVLTRLSEDAHVNVRHAALVAWREAALPGLTDAALAMLASDDGQLVLEAATLLKGAPAGEGTVEALRAAMRRLTAQRRETSRDPRIALLDRIGEFDTEAATLRTYLRDFDPVVARHAATLVNARLPPGAAPTSAAPSPLPHARVPTWQEVIRLDGRSVVLRLRGGRTVPIRLHAINAPTAVTRLVAQVRAGEWNGRTFHRVEPGFVVQGGSPAANEYAGAAAFTRDEFSALSNLRGTVGISTRGPDTGDGQIYVNLVDNVRLDFGFTVVGSIIGEDSVIDSIVEGEVIESASVEDAASGTSR